MVYVSRFRNVTLFPLREHSERRCSLVFAVHCGTFQGANIPVHWKDFSIEPLKWPTPWSLPWLLNKGADWDAPSVNRKIMDMQWNSNESGKTIDCKKIKIKQRWKMRCSLHSTIGKWSQSISVWPLPSWVNYIIWSTRLCIRDSFGARVCAVVSWGGTVVSKSRPNSRRPNDKITIMTPQPIFIALNNYLKANLEKRTLKHNSAW